MIWVGLDLPKRYLTAWAMDEAGAIVAEHRRLPAAVPRDPLGRPEGVNQNVPFCSTPRKERK